MKKYFLYYLKKCILPFIILTVFAIIVYVVPIEVHNYSGWNNPETLPEGYPDYLANRVNLFYAEFLVEAVLMAVITPVYVFNYKMNKRSADMFYSLPLSRTKIFAVHFLTGLLGIYAAATVAYWLGFAAIAARVRRLRLIYYLYAYLALPVPIFTCYSIAAFLYTRANTVADGVVGVLGGFLAGIALMYAIDDISSVFSFFYSFNLISFTPFGIMQALAPLFEAAYLKNGIALWSFAGGVYPGPALNNILILSGGILYTLLAAAATAYMFLTEKNCRAENCEQITESLFCYKTYIPFYLIIICAIATIDSAAFVCITVLAAVVATIAWRRTFKIGVKYAVLLCVYIAVALILACVFSMF